MYGIIISLGILIAALIAEKMAAASEKRSELVWQALIVVVAVGVVGARIYHVIDYWWLYSQNPEVIPMVWKGGLGIFGGLVAGVGALIVFLKVKKEKVWEWLDIFAVVTPLAQAIGRWGNYFNRELLGKPTNLPIGILVDGQKYHPLFLYESVLNLILFGVLYKVWQREQKDKTQKQKPQEVGRVFFLYLIFYSLIRFFLEFLKVQPWTVAGLNVAQGISIVFLFTGIVFLSKRKGQKVRG